MSEFTLERSVEVLERTPGVLEAMTAGLSDFWIRRNEGDGTWSPFDVVGHLVHGERTDWIPRLSSILEHGGAEPFEPFDRFAQLEENRGRALDELLSEFRELRQRNLARLAGFRVGSGDLARTGIHPDFGEVTLRQLLATWATHDLGHVAQIARVMARQYGEEVGPWREYLRVLED